MAAESASHHNPVAGLLRRLMACLYDWLLVIAIMMVLSVPMVALDNGEAIRPGTAWYRMTMLAVSVAYFVGFWCGYGRTPGMLAWRLIIQTPAGNRPNITAGLQRYAVACISIAALGVGFLWSLFAPDRLTWHDRLSGTVLILQPVRGR